MYQKLLLLARHSLKSVAKLAGLYLILRELKYLPGIAFLALIFTFLSSAFEGLGIGGISLLLKYLTSPNQAPIHTGFSWIDLWIVGNDGSSTNQLWRISALVLIVIWLRSVFSYLSIAFLEITQYKVLDRLRKRIFEQLQAFKVSYFTEVQSGELINTVTTEIERLKQAFGGIAALLTLGLTSLVYIVLIFLISWQLAIISIMLFSLILAGLSNFNLCGSIPRRSAA
jgi:subfamily B ATP-binding cassette protein MsbA